MTDELGESVRKPVAGLAVPPGRVFVSYAHTPNPAPDGDRGDEEAWRENVVQLVTALRRFGIEADADLFHGSDPEVDWTRWGPRQIADSARIIIAINAAWAERFEGRGKPTAGAGAAAEADELLGMFDKGRDDFTRRVVIVLLPGHTVENIPNRLRGIRRVVVPRFDLAGMTDLLRELTGQAEYELPPLGQLPALPPRLIDEVRFVSAAFTATATATSTVTGTTHSSGSAIGSATGTSKATGHASSEKEVEQLSAPSLLEVEQLVGARALLRAVQADDVDSEPPQQADLIERLTQLVDRLNQVVTPAPIGASAPAPTAAEQLAVRLQRHGDRLAGDLETENRCWLVLTAAPVSALTRADPSTSAGSGQEPRQRAEQLLRTLAQSRWLPVGPNGAMSGHRLASRVIFPGMPTTMSTARTTSTTWRAELADDGGGAFAANIAATVTDYNGHGIVVWGEEDPAAAEPVGVALQVRQDRLEVWLLVQLEFLAAHALTTAGLPVTIDASRADTAGGFLGNGHPDSGRSPRVERPGLALQARLVVPPTLTSSRAPQAPVLGVRIVREDRDAAGRRTGEHPAPGSVPLALDGEETNTTVLTASLAELDDPRALVRIARALALQLLAHAGVEDPLVLAADGHLEERAAAQHDQQLIYQHARALGLPVGDLSPNERRSRYDDLIQQAEDLYRQ